MIFKMLERYSTALRVVSVVAGTIISLACGTNYAYSAWAPQFSKRLGLSSTQSNLIGTSANFGMYLFGIPCGILIDRRGPRVGAVLGAFMLGAGYAGLYSAFTRGPGAVHMVFLCFFAAVSGVGGAAAFFGAIKVATMNWPNHRGTATAFPLAAFGLSAFLFSIIAGTAFHGDVAGLLLLFTIGTFLMILLSTPFMQIVTPTTQYAEVPTEPELDADEEGAYHYVPPRSSSRTPSVERPRRPASRNKHSTSRGHLLSPVPSPDAFPPKAKHADEAGPTDDGPPRSDAIYPDTHGIAMLRHSEFYELWILLGSLTGIGLMTINNLGNDAQALWAAWDFAAAPGSIEAHQKAYVSLLSLASFAGRLLSGIGSDVLVKRLRRSRFWCLFASAALFCAAQLLAVYAENPNLLALLAGVTGLAYGVLFGVMPVLVAETFGSSGISQNWGFMTLSPILFGNIFNIFYGRVYDGHSRTDAYGGLECLEGRLCYKDAYWLTFAVSVAAMFMILWCIHHRHIAQERAARMKREADEHLE